MLQINSVNNHNSKAISTKEALNNRKIYASQVSFAGIRDIFVSRYSHLPQITTLEGVSKDFAANIEQVIKQFPAKWLKRFKEEGYEIFLSKTINDGYKHKNLFDPKIMMFEAQNPKGLLGVTYRAGIGGTNFFVFADKPPFSNMFMKGIVNHEFSHGIVDILGLDKNPQFIGAIQKDMHIAINSKKFDRLSQNERILLAHYFFNQKAYLPIDEILADTIAWQQKGGGVYGSGLILGVDNPALIPDIFANLSNLVKHL